MTMDTAGKAVLFTGLTVLISLSAVMLVPSPAFRSMSLGIMLAVVFVLAATLTLLPAVLAKLGPRVDKLALQVGALRRAPLAALRRLGRAPVAPPAAATGSRGRGRSSRCRCRCSRSTPACRRSRSCPSGDGSRAGYEQVQQAFGPGATGALQIVAPRPTRRGVAAVAQGRPGHRAGHARRSPAPDGTGARSRPCPGRTRPTHGDGRDVDRLRAAARRRARRRRGRREPRPRAGARRPRRRS